MFIHFHSQSEFIVGLTIKEIKKLENKGENRYNKLLLQTEIKSNPHQEPFPSI
jgi:hypothetical protein